MIKEDLSSATPAAEWAQFEALSRVTFAKRVGTHSLRARTVDDRTGSQEV